jgi:uncharacterized protein YcgI (DUF1989 family)
VSDVLLSHDVPGGAAWSALVRAGRELRLTALGNGANCSTLLYAAHDPVDRLNIPDTLKAQMSACIRPPMVLMSDRGLALCSVTGSTLDWHDCITGHSLDAHVGPSSYHADRNDWRRSARAGLLSELRKHGRNVADLHACVNFFTKIAIADDTKGSLTFVPGHATEGDQVTLRSEVDLLILLSTAPNPLDPQWAPAGVRVEIRPGTAHSEGPHRPESERALQAAKAVFA